MNKLLCHTLPGKKWCVCSQEEDMLKHWASSECQASTSTQKNWKFPGKTQQKANYQEFFSITITDHKARAIKNKDFKRHRDNPSQNSLPIYFKKTRTGKLTRRLYPSLLYVFGSVIYCYIKWNLLPNHISSKTVLTFTDEVLCYRFSIAVFPKCVLQMFWSIIFPRQHQSSPREPFPKNQRHNLLRCTLTCRPSSREILSKVVSGGVLAGVAVLQASWASLNSKAGE